MKKIFTCVIAAMTAMSVMAQDDAETIGFAYEAGAEVVSAYIWRGQYNGGLSLQPEALVGFDALSGAIEFRIGAWGNIGASDWRFRRGAATYTDAEGNEIDPNTRFMPEIDIIGSLSLFGLNLGFNHYYYCDGTNFFNWKSVATIDAEGGTSTTEVWLGYNFGYFLNHGAYINWYTTIAGNDLVYDEFGDPHRAWSSYLELGYDYNFEDIGLTIGAQLGMSPWRSDLYGNSKFAVTNISLKIDKEWEIGPLTLDLFAQGSINPDGITRDNVYVHGSGDEKLYNQKLNGVIGLGFWF
ncbi:MAG: hypothetical protein K6F10_00630 [Paludibacteraceae bacterium]|nr:hypothetical protein [Paludibacteraceae bacterium]